MVRRSSPTLRNRELGALLKGYREARDLTAAQVAKDVGLPAATISRLENASRTSPRSGPPHVRALCSYYGLDAHTTERLVQMAKEGSQPGWWQRYNLESPLATYVDLESAAVAIDNFEATLIPGLLQTSEYAREVISPVRLHFSADQLDRTVESRIQRQRILTGENPLLFHAVIDEAALHRTVGNNSIMREQLSNIRRLATELPNVTVQILPFSVGANPGNDGGFSVLNFAEKMLPPVIYAEGQLGQIFEDDPDEVNRVKEIFAGLAGLALDGDQSLGMIDKLVRTLT
ncbi:transcriptional regulator with XRE-family HTH domain [Actinoplanes lutulentus]|uniref:Helix-turn-helix protein n=1 Tax=Actinoplanes lutulentus TaxID=1287878 RepID=A0A327YX58_9ACTN|nr:helix-turn-helix transcriptional regulator [Actinoplanes lutulentus]MBB2943474.1 transcriptional regulator with XRE-family HTH domain [Actinoplanes lutulentus]RAK26007.1 helix-turn-helix protein [Actinoplanes lutulentus]